MTETAFGKYEIRGPGYHWIQLSKSLRNRNLYVIARYELISDVIKNEISGKRILDVGCGDGVLAWILAKNGAEVIGIDNSIEAINFAREKCKNISNLKFEVRSVYKLPFENNYFDYIASSEVIEHLNHPAVMLSEMKRVWNCCGKLLITTPVRTEKKPLDKMHCQEFFVEDFKAIFKNLFIDYKIEIIKSHPVFWVELQNKKTLGRHFPKVLLNLVNLTTGINPFKSTRGWTQYTLQTVVISK